MLIFIRKYQQLLFSLIAAVVICSLLFFGTFSVLSSEPKGEDPIVGHAVDGSAFRLSEVRSLARFIASDREDGASLLPNFCNDGVVRHDLLRSGLAQLLIHEYFTVFKKDFETRLERVKKFRPYVHPQADHLSAKALWERFTPALLQQWDVLQKEVEASPKTFSLLSHLYQLQSYFPPETLRRFLLLQQQQYSGLPFDPKLQQGDFSLFGFRSLSDWFGPQFLDLSAQFILNGACLAEQKGYRVSLEEAKADLALIFEDSMKKLAKAKERDPLSLTEHLRSLGFDLKRAAESWRKVLLFRRYFQGISQATLLDRLSLSDFAHYASETALVDLYQWPSALQLHTFSDLIDFQIYLQAMSPPSKDPLSLPVASLPQEAVEKSAPELVPFIYKVKLGGISLNEAALQAPMKEVWDWELDDQHWKLLQSRFEWFGAAEPSLTRQERFQRLEKLTLEQRVAIDAFAKQRLISSHPEWIAQALQSAPLKETTIVAAKDFISLPHIQKREDLLCLLQAAAQGDAAAQEKLCLYSEGDRAYRIENVEELPRSILTFKEAKEYGLLTKLSDRILKAEYLKIRDARPKDLQDKKGDWKPFCEVKEIVAKHFFADLLKEIHLKGKIEGSDADYAAHRLLAPTESFRSRLLNSQPLLEEESPLVQQFQMEKRECQVARREKGEWMQEQVFMMIPNQWSQIRVAPTGDISFFYVREKRVQETPLLEQMVLGQEILAEDAQRYMAERFLESVKSKKSIVIPLQGGQEYESF
jgi:hypothetical protein